MLERVLDRGLQIAELAAAVVTLALELIGEHLLLLEQRLDAVGELNLATRTGCDLLQQREDARRQNITANDGERRRRLVRARLLDDAIHLVQAGLQGLAAHD